MAAGVGTRREYSRERNSDRPILLYLPVMKKLLTLLTAVLALLVLPSVAPARVIEIGRANDAEELPAPSCPNSPCFAISRTTGYQAKVGTNRGLMRVPENGRIVAWSIRLSRPGPRQVSFFNERLGGKPSAGLAVLRNGARLFGRVSAVSPVVDLERYLGQSVQFPLEQSLPVRKGMTIALSVPTWAPALATGLGSDTSWRASRPAGECDDTSTQTVQAEARDLAQYRCLYQRVRLSYSATMVTTPAPNPDSGGQTQTGTQTTPTTP
jgi:hypothetical protein